MTSQPVRLCSYCGDPLPSRRRRFCCDLCRIRGQRAERVTENNEFGKAAIRMIRTLALRVGASDLAEFGAMWEVMAEAEHAVTETIDALRKAGFSWAQIGAEIGWDKQRLSQWRKRRAGDQRKRNVYGRPPAEARSMAGQGGRLTAV